MNDIRLPEKNTATRNSFEIFVKGLGALSILGAFFWGLFQGLWALPEVQQFVFKYIAENSGELFKNLAVYGIPTAFLTGLVNLWFDWRKKNMRNY